MSNDIAGYSTGPELETVPVRRGVSFARCRLVKRGCRPADALLMAPRPERGWDESTRAAMLRAQYRCAMCHKRCLVPCRFTAAEFRRMEEDRPVGESSDPVAESSDRPAGAE